MTYQTPPTSHRPAGASRRRRALGATVLSVLLGTSVVPFFSSPAGAVGTRSSQEKVSCNFGGRANAPSATAGTAYTCTVNVGDTGAGATIRPTGTASLVLTGTAGTAPVSDCTLQPVSSNNWDTTCTINLVVYSAGTLNVSASYSGDATFSPGTAASKDQVTGVSVSNGSNLGVVANVPGTSGANAPGSLGVGAQFTVYSANCSVTSGTAQGYVLVGVGVDPQTTTSFIIGPRTVGADKVFSLPVSITADQASGTFVARYVCAKGTVTSATDADIVFTSNTYTTTISAGAALLRSSGPTSDGTVVRSAKLANPAGETALPLTATLTFDTDAANVVDTFGILKDSADALKAATDKILPSSSIVSRLGYLLVDGGLDRASTERWTTAVANRTASPVDVAAAVLAAPGRSAFTAADEDKFVAGLYLRGLGREASSTEMASATASLRAGTASRAQLAAAVATSPDAATRWQFRSYAVAAYQATTATMPSSGDLASAVARLQSGTLKVNVVEDIALTAAPASEWNALLPTGKRPAAATFVPPKAPAPVAAPAPAPAAVAPPSKKAAAARPSVRRPVRNRSAVRPSVRSSVRKVAPRKATVSKTAVRTAPTRKVVVKRTAVVRKVRR